MITQLSSCDILDNLKFDLGYVLRWLKIILSISSFGKFHFMILDTNTNIQINSFLNRNKILKSQEGDLLGVNINHKLSFKTLIKNICRKQNLSLHKI